MMTPESLRPMVQTLLNSQIQAVLATQHQQQPYTSLMAFAVTPDLRQIVFATARATQKYANLMTNPRASLLIDNRGNDSADYRNAVAISAQGVTREVDAAQRAERLQLYLSKHPQLRDFVTDAACALLQLDVECYYVVSQFQNVVEWRFSNPAA
ncbi:pyridoxamine 5'-phosphate oxidase family protein [Candidatus Contendibacter odensensis]|nr:pyridoxamine 5'-phosphate oxidase family protein [Candidatus Contendobacter odensis]